MGSTPPPSTPDDASENLDATGYESLEERIMQVRRRDRRFTRNAYYFALDALDFTMARLGKDRKTGEERHVGGRELLSGIQEFAAENFGPMANVVFRRWGIHTTEDFGEIVFNLIDAGLLSRRAEDSRLDFASGIDFERVFAEKFNERIAAISEPANG